MYQALHATSVTLQQYLTAQIKADNFLYAPTSPFRARSMAVVLNTPKEMDENTQEGVSLWLYRIVRDEDRLNDPPRRIAPNLVQPTPLPLRLHYLVTPLTSRDNAGDPETEQYLLGKIMQAFYSHPILGGSDLQQEFAGTSVQLHVRLETLSIDEIGQIWQALEGPYLLSVSYEVAVVDVDAALQPILVAPVHEFEPRVGLIEVTS
jgi:Pvc16 N-terminal domain